LSQTFRWLLLVWTAVVVACSEDATGPPPTPPPPPPPPAFAVAGLKEIVRSSLPSPYYHFEYDSVSTDQVSFVSFASDFTRYDIIYRDGRISEMDNNILVNHDRLVYVYNRDGRVTQVREVDDQGVLFEQVLFVYSEARLIGLERHRRINGTLVVDKTVTMSYFPDGNLRELAQHRPAIAGFQDEQRYNDSFEQYDTGINVDNFDLLHDDFFDHLFLLPVELQKGNPRRVTRTGDGSTFVVEYTYAYDVDGRPLTRSGLITLTNGANAGQQFQTSSVYTYY